MIGAVYAIAFFSLKVVAGTFVLYELIQLSVRYVERKEEDARMARAIRDNQDDCCGLFD